MFFIDFLAYMSLSFIQQALQNIRLYEYLYLLLRIKWI